MKSVRNPEDQSSEGDRIDVVSSTNGSMATVAPRDALKYGLSREMAILYGVVLAGYVAILLGGWFLAQWSIRGGGAGFIGQLLAAAFFLLGFVAVLGGLIGLVYKVIADANHIAHT